MSLEAYPEYHGDNNKSVKGILAFGIQWSWMAEDVTTCMRLDDRGQ